VRRTPEGIRTDTLLRRDRVWDDRTPLPDLDPGEPSAAPVTIALICRSRGGTREASRGISRRQLADALGVHYQTIGYLERGEYSPSLYLALRIAEYFEVPVEVVFSTTPFPRIGSAERSA
jgi:DNA-binding XRE family transcriptional regulator